MRICKNSLTIFRYFINTWEHTWQCLACNKCSVLIDRKKVDDSRTVWCFCRNVYDILWVPWDRRTQLIRLKDINERKIHFVFCCLCIWVYVYGCVDICQDEIQGVAYSQQVDLPLYFKNPDFKINFKINWVNLPEIRQFNGIRHLCLSFFLSSCSLWFNH